MAHNPFHSTIAPQQAQLGLGGFGGGSQSLSNFGLPTSGFTQQGTVGPQSMGVGFQADAAQFGTGALPRGFQFSPEQIAAIQAGRAGQPGAVPQQTSLQQSLAAGNPDPRPFIPPGDVVGQIPGTQLPLAPGGVPPRAPAGPLPPGLSLGGGPQGQVGGNPLGGLQVSGDPQFGPNIGPQFPGAPNIGPQFGGAQPSDGPAIAVTGSATPFTGGAGQGIAGQTNIGGPPGGNQPFTPEQIQQFLATNAGNLPPRVQQILTQSVRNDPLRFGTTGGITSAGPDETPLTGLRGSEQAILQGLQGGTAALNLGAEQARGDVSGGLSRALGLLGQTSQDINQQFGQARGGLDPFLQAGTGALQQQQALSGALGQEAFDQALTDSPAQRFLQEQGQRAITQTAAATGGLGGGEVLKELTRFGQGLASTDLQNQIGNLRDLSGQGLQAGQGLGQLLAAQAGQTSGLGQAGAGFQQGAGQFSANLAQRRGQDIGASIGGASQIIAGDRLQTGRDISGAIGGTTSALAQLINQQGGDLSNILGTGATNLAGIQTGAGAQSASNQQQLATLLANLGLGQSGQVSGLPGIGQFVGPNTDIADTAAVLSALGGIAGQFNQPPPPAVA